ncbi:hypothetical protein IZT14_002212 [Clostridium perfringens]
MADNSHGNNNEDILVSALNQKSFNNLNKNLKKFISCIDPSINNDDIIYAEKLGGQKKSDIQLKVKNKKYNISVKMGQANSVHQEKIEDFITFLKENYNISDDLSDSLRFFIWGDGTLDGTAPLKDRMSVSTLKKKHPELIEKINLLLSNHKNELIDRFIFVGRHDDSIDYIYHGNDIKGSWASKKEIFPYLLNSTNKRAVISVGILTFQAWNRSLKGTTDEKRGEIQLKCGQLGSILDTIMNERTF